MRGQSLDEDSSQIAIEDPTELAEPDLPELPELPRQQDGMIAPAPVRKASHLLRRGPIHESFIGTSSDPPFFSSDDITPSSDNYSERRKKKRWIGPWWSDSKATLHKKRKIERNVDSGVWVDSDVSIVDSDIPSSELGRFEESEESSQSSVNPLLEVQLGSTRDSGGERKNSISKRDGDEEVADASQPSSKLLRLRLARPNVQSWVSRHALEVVEQAVENGQEDIDLSGAIVWRENGSPSDNSSNSNIFHPLHHLVKTRAIYDPGRFEELVPDLRLWLTNNNLPSLPSEVYRLTNITMLGLRQNSLRTLSGSIGNLERLQTLNLTSNRIEWLPAEITRLQFLMRLYVDASHFVQPLNDVVPTPKLERQERTARPRWDCVVISQVSYLDACGRPIPGSPPRPSQEQVYKPTRKQFEPRRTAEAVQGQGSRVPSLLATALRNAAEKLDLAPFLADGQTVRDLADHENLLRLLHLGLDVADAGGQACDCGRAYIVPRAEWLEWAYWLDSNLLIPLLRRACSWPCALDAQASLDAKDLSKNTRVVLRGCGWERAVV